jgi:hypothetical protein
MLFKAVIGQKDVKQQLVELVEHNRLSHALLFLGKEGSGALPSLWLLPSTSVFFLPSHPLLRKHLCLENP